MTEVANPPENKLLRRRSQRVLMQVSVTLKGVDAKKKPFKEDTQTYAVNAHGGLVGLKTEVTKGTVLSIQHKMTDEVQECRVVFLGPVRDEKTEIGLEFSSPRPTFWRVAFPPEDWTPKHPEARDFTATRPVEK